MKKFLTFVAIGTTVCMLGGCGNAAKSTDTTGSVAEMGIDANEYVELGDYKGLSVTVEKTVISEEDIDNELQAFVEENAKLVKIKDRKKVKDNDWVNIDYALTIDGEEIEEYSETEVDLVIGEGDYVLDEGFDLETPLIGATVGKTVTIDVKFPDNYEDPEYAGKAGVVKVTVNKIMKEVLPELTDKLVKNNTDCSTIAEYREQLRAELEDQYAEDEKTSRNYQVWTAVVDAAKQIKDFPEDMVAEQVAVLTEENETWAGYFGLSVEDFISQYYDMTMEEYAIHTIKESCVESLLMEAEGIVVTDEDYQNQIQVMIDDYGYAEEDIAENYTEEEIRNEIAYDRLMEKLVSYTNITEKEVSMEDSADTE